MRALFYEGEGEGERSNEVCVGALCDKVLRNTLLCVCAGKRKLLQEATIPDKA